MVLHTIVDYELRAALEAGLPASSTWPASRRSTRWWRPWRAISARRCRRGSGPSTRSTHDYFERMDALNFAMAHDDGQGAAELEGADVVLVGVSRTSKTPTCIYLAHRGIRAANVPLVPGAGAADGVHTEASDRRRPDRVAGPADPDPPQPPAGLHEDRASAYIEHDAVRDEIVHARRAFERHGWPMIDVTRRSVEETAAAIINLLISAAATGAAW